MDEEEFVNPNFIVTQKINQIGKVLNDLKEKQSDILINRTLNSQNTPDYVKLQLIKQHAVQDARNYTEQIKIIQEENKNRILYLKKPISTVQYQPENEKKYKKPTTSQQILKLENTYKDLYFGSDVLSDCLKADEDVIPLIKRRSNASVLIKKDTNSYEYMYSNYQTNCLQGIQFTLNSNLLTNHQNIDIKKQVEYNPLKKSSSILGLNKITINEKEYLQVRCVYNLHHLKINEKREVLFKGVEQSYFSDDNQNYKELLDCAQSSFFEEEQYILAEGNSLFKTSDLGKTSQHTQLKNLKSNIESIDVSYHPYSIYLQMTDSIGLFDFRSKDPNILHKVPTKKVPLHRIYGLKNLEENYLMVSTTQHFKIYDIRCTNYPVFSVHHGSDECPPSIINIHSTGNENQNDEEDSGDIIDTLMMQDDTMKIMKAKGSERIITSYSPHKNSDIIFMRWNKGSTLLESLYEQKGQQQPQQSSYTPKNANTKNKATSIFYNKEKSDQYDDNEGINSSQSIGNDFNFKFLSSLEKQKSSVSNNKKEEYNFFQNNNSDNSQQSFDEIREKKMQSTATAYEDNEENNSGETDKKLQKHHILGRESKGERLCFNQEVKNLFQPKSILASSQISDTLKIRGVCTAFFDEQDKFITIQNDQRGGVATQIFSRKNEASPLTCNYIPLKAVSSTTTPLVNISKNDPQLNSITDLQVMKIFEQPDYTDQNTTNGELLTEPVRLRKQKKKQVNMYPYFMYLREQVDPIKSQNSEEINKFIESQKKKRSKSQSSQSQKSAVDSLLSSQFNTLNMAEIGSTDKIKETIMEQNNLLSVYHDKYAYPEFRKNMRYNTKNIVTDKIAQVLEDYWD